MNAEAYQLIASFACLFSISAAVIMMIHLGRMILEANKVKGELGLILKDIRTNSTCKALTSMKTDMEGSWSNIKPQGGEPTISSLYKPKPRKREEIKKRKPGRPKKVKKETDLVRAFEWDPTGLRKGGEVRTIAIKPKKKRIAKTKRKTNDGNN